MTALRCTAKLLGDMKATPVTRVEPPLNRLGEWTANRIGIGRRRLIIAVSEPTRLAVVIEAAPYATIPKRLCEALRGLLVEIGVPVDAATAEIEAMRPLEVAATTSKSLLGTLNQFGWQVECAVRDEAGRSATHLTIQLARMIVLKPVHIVMPVDRAREAFGLPLTDRIFRDSLGWSMDRA